jgi:hypothetical protein
MPRLNNNLLFFGSKEMNRILVALVLLFFVSVTAAETIEGLRVPGMVIGLHNLLMPAPKKDPGPGFSYWNGGDFGGRSTDGFAWIEAKQDGSHSVDWKSLPPGIVVSLKHSINQAKAPIQAFGRDDPVTGPMIIPGFIRRFGGDIGAPANHGYYWYESHGEDPTDWSLISQLPIGTVVGLRHTENNPFGLHKQKGYGIEGNGNLASGGGGFSFMWRGGFECRDRNGGVVKCDARDASITPPNGFIRVVGGDVGIGNPQKGFVWYEKRTVAKAPKVDGNQGGASGQGSEISGLVGCFSDKGDPKGLSGRDLPGYMMEIKGMTIEACLSLCNQQGYTYAGVQYGRQCFCGNSYGRYGQSMACNMPCEGNPKQNCGGGWANAVYRIKQN